MLLSLIKSWSRPARAQAQPPRKLHVGGQAAHPEWKIFDVRPGPGVDFVGNCTDLSQFADQSIEEVYASHVLEHLGYMHDLPAALREINRVLVPGGVLRMSVPDLETLCGLFLDPAASFQERFHVMRMMFGGQSNAADFHAVGLNEEFLRDFLNAAGFVDIERCGDFGLFDDCSSLVFRGKRISLNLIARKRSGG